MSQGVVLPSTMEDFSFQSSLNNKLIVKNLSRVHQHAVYTCHASNFHKRGVSTNVTVELYRKLFITPYNKHHNNLHINNKTHMHCVVFVFSATIIRRDNVPQPAAILGTRIRDGLWGSWFKATGENHLVDGRHRAKEPFAKGKYIRPNTL